MSGDLFTLFNPESERYPVHFQQNAGFSFMISKVGVREAGAATQRGSLEATNLL